MASVCNIPTIKVVKFGGSSLADAEQFLKVKNIIESDKTRVFVVPSAPGKRYNGDTKVTDLLLSSFDAYGTDAFTGIFSTIKDRYNSIIADLKLNMSLDDEYDIILRKFANGCNKDYVASRGEYLNGKILAAHLNYNFIDDSELIIFY